MSEPIIASVKVLTGRKTKNGKEIYKTIGKPIKFKIDKFEYDMRIDLFRRMLQMQILKFIDRFIDYIIHEYEYMDCSCNNCRYFLALVRTSAKKKILK